MALLQLSQLPLLATRSLAAWADVTVVLGTILVNCLKAEAHAGAAMFYAITSALAQRQALEAAAKVVLGEKTEEFDILLALLKHARVLARAHRNRFAHYVWAISSEIPHALLFVQPEAIVEYEIVSKRIAGPHVGRTITQEDDFDRSKVWVYREKDLKEAADALEELAEDLAQFSLLLKVRRWGWPDNNVFHETLFPMLIARPHVAEFLSRQREGRRSAP